MSLKVATAVILLALFIHHSEGFKRVIVVKLDAQGNSSSDNESRVKGNHYHCIIRSPCCIYGNCSCPSLYNALANLTSNVLINVTTDVELSSIITLVNLANVTIVGHNNPSMNCINSGGLYFETCYNCTIEGIAWKGCGARNISDDANVHPVLQLHNSSSITIHNCSFQQSVGQAVVLSGMSQDVNIKNCNFLYNNQYEGYGAAIHYSSNTMLIGTVLKIVIRSCNFLYNGKAKSVVHFSQFSTKLIFHNLKFHHNEGVPIYLSNQDLHVSGNMEFCNNIAENGGGIFISNHSNVVFHKSATVNFTNNTANNNGGAIFLTNHSSILFKDPSTSHRRHDYELYGTLGDQHSLSIFYNNKAHGYGQDIYTHNSKITIGSSATVIFIQHNHFSISNSSTVYIDFYSTVTFDGTSKTTFNNHNVRAMYITDYSTVIFEGHSTVTFNYGSRSHFISNGGAIYTDYNSTIAFIGASIITFSNYLAQKGGAVYINDFSTLKAEGSCTLTFNNNRADTNGGAVYIDHHSTITFEGNSTLIFNNNVARRNGGAMYIEDFSHIVFEGNSSVMLNYNIARRNGGGIYFDYYSHVTFQGRSTVTFNNNAAHRNGGAMYNKHCSDVVFKGNSSVTFNNNVAHTDGGAVSVDFRSRVTYGGSSAVTFNYNKARRNGGAMYIKDFSHIVFEGNSSVMLNYNIARRNGGGIYFDYYSGVTFQGRSTVTFNNNAARRNGGAMYDKHCSDVVFKGNSSVTFNNNVAHTDGGAVSVDSRSRVTYGGSSAVTFNYNKARNNGGAMYVYDSSDITFKGNSAITFSNNVAHGSGGAMYIDYHLYVTFGGNSTVTFNENVAYGNGGAVYIEDYSTVTFFGQSSAVTFNNNEASNGGGMYIDYSSTTVFEGSSMVTFSDNEAYKNGGGMHINYFSIILFERSPTVAFKNNKAQNNNGGAMYIDFSSIIEFKGDSTVIFSYNTAFSNGGVIHVADFSNITFEGNSTVTFNNNMVYANNGGVMHIYHSTITFQGNCTVEFYNNVAYVNNGGAMYIDHFSTITFTGNSTVRFHTNTADDNGGGMFISDDSDVTFKEKSTVIFYNNTADDNGGAFYIGHNSTGRFKENSTVTFKNNTANLGGSVFSESSPITIEGEDSSITFINNTALQDGGAIYLSDNSKFSHFNNSRVTFLYNTASVYGGAIYTSFKGSLINFNSSNVYFKDNIAGTIQNSVYINVPASCDTSCLFRSVIITNKHNIQFTTSPYQLILYRPAKCINGNDTNCDTYYINNVMLGQELTFDACVLDCYGQPTDLTQFSITGMNHQDYNISGSKYITISCNHTTQGITVIGNLHSNNSYNYSLTISLHVTRMSESKIISVNLIVEISQCHPGFWYSSALQTCECYDTGNIISCSDSNSTIKRGYWFGSVTGQPTVTTCPNDYCNFTCCEITNGIYHLSPARANQCKSHRSGNACGNCNEGYTLSFDSPECVEVNECTTGQTVLVTTLSLLYWLAVVVAVYAMMYFQVAVGSLYGIIYYYSIVDILLSQVLFISNGLYTTVTIMSSLAKLTPQFLGHFCLVRNMSGIDQQFVHYVHPTVISFILIIITVLARKSHRISSFVSKGIIHFICFLLLLSYTSMTTTSLLLMRPLKYMGINKVYTYLSPDIEYFNSRHLVYVVVAIIFMVVIVVGLPLLLLLEPFLNSKVNFIKIKPLLDQFQGCYKDKYRYFAGYYMLCRLVIILLVIVKISDDFTNQLLLISACALMQLIHVLVRPYVSAIHNIFDGIILQLIVVISLLPLVELVDNYDETLVLMITYLLVTFPLISFAAIKLWINKNNIQNSFKQWAKTCLHKHNGTPTSDAQQPVEMKEFGVVIDDNMRRNAMIVDVSEHTEERLPDIMWCREPFMEELNEIEAFNDIKN